MSHGWRPRPTACQPGSCASNNLKKSLVDLQALTTIQQNNLTPQPPHSRDPITLTVCVTTHPSTTSRQHHFHQSAPLYMENDGDDVEEREGQRFGDKDDEDER